MPATVRVNGPTLAHRASRSRVRSTLADVGRSSAAPVPYVDISDVATLAKGTLTVHAGGGNTTAVKGWGQ